MNYAIKSDNMTVCKWIYKTSIQRDLF